MLVLSRKTKERILIGDTITLTVVRIGPNNVRIGIEAPLELNIVREEIAERFQTPATPPPVPEPQPIVCPA
jgi:carbon storage regulator